MDYTNNRSEYLKELRDICILKGFSRQTIKSYCYNVKRFLEFIEKSRLNLDNVGVKSYLLALDLSVNSMRLKYAAIRFFFSEVLKQPFTTEEIPIKKKEKSLPKLLSKEQIIKLIDGTDNLKHKIIQATLFFWSALARVNQLKERRYGL